MYIPNYVYIKTEYALMCYVNTPLYVQCWQTPV